MKKLLGALLLLASFNVLAADPQLGKDFDKTLQTIPTDTPDKIEVTEIFWYGCIHCYHMEPVIDAWVKKLPADVVFKRLPGLPNPSWDKTLNPTDEAAAIAWMTKKSGLDKSKVEAAFKSFSMNNNLNRAAQTFKASGATGVPSLIIDGQFITSSTMAGGNGQALKVTDYIIGNLRADKAKAATPSKK
jgi:thiol:disulfide interchange protein DsbA